MDSHWKGFAVFFDHAAGNGDRWDTSDVCIDGVDIVEIHRKQIQFGADLERRMRGCRTEKDVALREGGVELVLDKASDLKSSLVVRVVVTGAEYVGAKHDSTLYFRAEPLASGSGVE